MVFLGVFFKPKTNTHNVMYIYITNVVLICVCGCRYDPVQEIWTPVEPMYSARIGLGVTVVNRLLYAVGGFNGDERLSSVEFYHPELNAWKYAASMKYARSGAGKITTPPPSPVPSLYYTLYFYN